MLPDEERGQIKSTLIALHARLEQAGELLAAMHLAHARQCLDLDDPINCHADLRTKVPADPGQNVDD